MKGASGGQGGEGTLFKEEGSLSPLDPPLLPRTFIKGFMWRCETGARAGFAPLLCRHEETMTLH